MYKYKCMNPIAKIGLNNFTDQYEAVDNVDEAEGILVRSANMLEMDFSDNLLAIARAGAGVNNISTCRVVAVTLCKCQHNLFQIAVFSRNCHCAIAIDTDGLSGVVVLSIVLTTTECNGEVTSVERVNVLHSVFKTLVGKDYFACPGIADYC